MIRLNRFFIPLAVFGTALGTLFLTGCGEDTGERKDAAEFEQTYDISGDYSVLDIQVSTADLTIRAGEEASMEVHMAKWYKMEEVLQDGTLYLTEKHDGPFWQKIFHFGTVNNSVLITLPEEAVEQLIVSGANGDVDISDQNIETMSVSESNGKISISNCQSTTVEMENANGGIFIDTLTDACLTARLSNGKLELANSGLASLDAINKNGKIMVSDVSIPEVDVSTKNGKVIFEKTETDSITVDSANGSIELELSGDEKSYNYKVGSKNGEITIGRNSFGNVKNELTLTNDAKKNVVLDSSNGSCTITFFQKSK